MATVQETIPAELADAAEAARSWFARERGAEFKLTGIVDPEAALAGSSDGGGRRLQLILCGSDKGDQVCLRETFEVRAAGGSFDVTNLEEPKPEAGSPAPLLDPPVGVREGWLEATLSKHAFVVLVFYRGFW